MTFWFKNFKFCGPCESESEASAKTLLTPCRLLFYSGLGISALTSEGEGRFSTQPTPLASLCWTTNPQKKAHTHTKKKPKNEKICENSKASVTLKSPNQSLQGHGHIFAPENHCYGHTYLESSPPWSWQVCFVQTFYDVLYVIFSWISLLLVRHLRPGVDDES